MTAQPATRPTAGSPTTRTADAGPVARTTRPATRARGRALLVALGVALAATVLPVAEAHASPQAPDVGNQLSNPGGDPQPPEPPDPQQGGPRTSPPRPTTLSHPSRRTRPTSPTGVPTTSPTRRRTLSLPSLRNRLTTAPATSPTRPRTPTRRSPNPNPDPVSAGGDSISTPQRVDAGFGGTAGPHQAAGVALIAAAIVLTLLVIVIARRHQAEARSNR